MRLITWNVAARWTALPDQVAAIAGRAPDVLAVQEVTARTLAAWREALPALGLGHIVSSFDLAPDPPLLVGARRYGEIIASRWPLAAMQPSVLVPWPERLLSARIARPQGVFDLHTAHIPPGASQGWIKIETLEGIRALLTYAAAVPRVLCGDFNTPQRETPAGEVLTWAQRDRTGRLIASRGAAWDAGERGALVGLADWDLPDVFRQLHGYGVQESSWVSRAWGGNAGRRFDHVFASAVLDAREARYLHEWRERGLSDHSALEVIFASSRVRRGRGARG